MKLMKSVCAAALMFGLGHAWAINKCIGVDGRPVFQDAPCTGMGGQVNVRPAAGSAASLAGKPEGAALSGDPVKTAAKPQTEADRLNALSAASAKDRKRWELRESLIPTAQNALAAHKQECALKIAQIESGQYQYVQNLYGKTHAAQMASEKAAVAAVCDTQDRELKDRLDTVQRECAAVSCKS